MRYNLGCGFDYKRNWINVDRSASVGPDVVHDLLSFPWPFEDDSADEIVLYHLIEELFHTGPNALAFFKELYRIAKPNCRIHVRLGGTDSSERPQRNTLTAKFFEKLDLARCEDAIGQDEPDTCHAINLEVDFALQAVNQVLHEPWSTQFDNGEVKLTDIQEASRTFNNVVKFVDLQLSAQKPYRPGRSLRDREVLVVSRLGGLGDVLMALSAFRAIKSVADIEIYFETKAEYAGFAKLCPHVDAVFSTAAEIPLRLRQLQPEKIKVVDWSGTRFGLSHRHEVDAFLQSLGLFLNDDLKGLDIALPPSPRLSLIDTRLDALGALPRIVIHPGVTDPNRTWPASFWQAVARHALDQGCAVITIGRNGGTEGKGVAALDEPGLIHFSDSLDLAETLYLLRQCDMLISGDAGPVQIAGGSDIRIVGLYSSVHGAVRMPFRHGSRFFNAVALEPACSIHPCYSRMMDPLWFSKFCQQDKVDPKDLSKIFATWCLNPDRYACINEPQTLEQTKAEITRLSAFGKTAFMPTRKTSDIEALA